MKKIFITFAFFLLVQPVFSVPPGVKRDIKTTIQQIKQETQPTVQAIKEETREEIKERLNQATSPGERQEIRQEIRERNKGLLDQIKNQVKEKLQNLKFSARVTGEVTGIGEGSLTVKDETGQVFTVLVNEKTKLRRHFWGQAEWTDFSVGNQVTVIGRFTNEEKTTIEAILIKNNSVQRRWGVFFGKVVEKNADNFVIESVNRGKITVRIANASFVDRTSQPINYYEVQVDHRVRVKGVWDKSLSEIIKTEEVKDFSLPAIPTKEPTTTE